MVLPHVSRVQGYIHNPKVSQAFEFADFIWGPNRELVLKYTFRPLRHVGTGCLNDSYQQPNHLFSV